MYATTYKITGNPYNNRYALKEMYATWCPEDKAWYVNLGGNGSTDTLWSLRRAGCKVEAVGKAWG